MTEGTRLYGLLAVFATADRLTAAAVAARQAGYQRVEAYTSFPVPEVSDALGRRVEWLPYIMLASGLIGAAVGYGIQYYSVAIDYPINVGGRPYHSWPSFLVITFELGILGAALGGLFGMLALNRLPQYYHPLFNVPQFSFAEGDRFFLCVEAADPRFDREETAAFLRRAGAQQVEAVPQ